MHSFKEEDAEYFYGRTQVTQQLLEKVGERNFVAVLGASGSGKSSGVRAGVLLEPNACPREYEF